MDGALVVFKGVEEPQLHNSFGFLKGFRDTVTVSVFIPKLTPQEEVENFAVVFREYNPEKKTISSKTQQTLQYPFTRSIFSPKEEIIDFEFQDNFWFKRDDIPDIKFYYAKATFKLAKLKLKEKKFYDVSIKSGKNYYHKYYIMMGRQEEFSWTNFAESSTANKSVTFFFETLLMKLEDMAKAQELTMILYSKMIMERNDTHTFIAQMVADGAKIKFENITASHLEKSPPDLLNQLSGDPFYLIEYLLDRTELGSRKQFIEKVLDTDRDLWSLVPPEIFDAIKPSQKSLADAINFIGMYASWLGVVSTSF